MKLKSHCCKKYKKKAKACKGCPVLVMMGKKQRRRKLEKARRRLRRAA